MSNEKKRKPRRNRRGNAVELSNNMKEDPGKDKVVMESVGGNGGE